MSKEKSGKWYYCVRISLLWSVALCNFPIIINPKGARTSLIKHDRKIKS